jgi:hypothetical protein
MICCFERRTNYKILKHVLRCIYVIEELYIFFWLHYTDWIDVLVCVFGFYTNQDLSEYLRVRLVQAVIFDLLFLLFRFLTRGIGRIQHVIGLFFALAGTIWHGTWESGTWLKH